MFKAFSPLGKKFYYLSIVAFCLSALPSLAVITEDDFDVEESLKLAKGPEFSASIQVGIWRKELQRECVNATALRGRALVISAHVLEEDDFQQEVGEDGIVTYRPFIVADRRSWGRSQNPIIRLAYGTSLLYTKEGEALTAANMTDTSMRKLMATNSKDLIQLFMEVDTSTNNIDSIHISPLRYNWLPGLKGRQALIKLKEPVKAFQGTKIARLNNKLSKPMEAFFCSFGIDGTNTKPAAPMRANSRGKYLVRTTVHFEGNSLVHQYLTPPGAAPHQFLSKGDAHSLTGIPWNNDSGTSLYIQQDGIYYLAGIYEGTAISTGLLSKKPAPLESKDESADAAKGSRSGKTPPTALSYKSYDSTAQLSSATIHRLTQIGAAVASNIDPLYSERDDRVNRQLFTPLFDLLPWITQCLEEKTIYKPHCKPAATRVGVPSARASGATAASSSALSDGIAKLPISKPQS